MRRRALAVLGLLGAAGSAALGAGDPAAAVRAVDAMRDQGVKVFATYPIFHQLVAFSFPRGFVPAFEDSHPPSYLQESVLAGENVNKWSQMISVSGAQGAATNPATTPEKVAGSFVRRFQQTCPATFAGLRLPANGLARFDGTATVLGCGSVGAPGQAYSEAVLLITLRGDQDYYTLQWAERGPASPAPMTYDPKKWSDRLQQLMPIRVCPRVPGESAPYPSCIDPPAD